MKIDFSGVEVNDLDPVPAGPYIVKVTDYELKEAGPNAKNPGSEYYNWEFTIQSGDHQGRKLWLNTSLLPKALFRLKELLAASGKFTEEQLSGDFDFEPEDLMGADIKVVVKIRPASGDYDAQNEIKRIKPVDAEDSAESSLLP